MELNEFAVDADGLGQVKGLLVFQQPHEALAHLHVDLEWSYHLMMNR